MLVRKFSFFVLLNFAFSILICCKECEIEVIRLQVSNSSIPEGITVHPDTEEIYISSIRENNIIKSSPNGKNTGVILSNKDNGYSRGVGLEIWHNKLYALSSYNRVGYSILTIKDLKTSIISTTKIKGKGLTYFNDLAIDKKGNAYITDTENSKIYYYNIEKGEIHIFLINEEIKYPNGIAISDDQTKLFVDSYTNGIRIVDIKTKNILNRKHYPTIEKGIDGLKYHNGALYMIVNGKSLDEKKYGLYKALLNSGETEITHFRPQLVNHEKMNIPTTLSIRDNFIYILANSQMDNLNQITNEIINKDILQKTYVLKMKIK